MAEKTDLLAKCKDLVEQVKEEERKTASELRQLYREVEQSLELDRKKFKDGYEERLQKVRYRRNLLSCTQILPHSYVIHAYHNISLPYTTTYICDSI